MPHSLSSNPHNVSVTGLKSDYAIQHVKLRSQAATTVLGSKTLLGEGRCDDLAALPIVPKVRHDRHRVPHSSLVCRSASAAGRTAATIYMRHNCIGASLVVECHLTLHDHRTSPELVRDAEYNTL